MDRRTFIGTSAAAAAVPTQALGLVFRQGGIPEVKPGTFRGFIGMTRYQGRENVLPIYYLNAYPLEHEDCVCASEEIHESGGGDGCPVTGWFYDESNFEYEHCYYPVNGDVTAWAPMPTVANVKSAITS